MLGYGMLSSGSILTAPGISDTIAELGSTMGYSTLARYILSSKWLIFGMQVSEHRRAHESTTGIIKQYPVRRFD